MPLDVLLLGVQGSGKGTQANRIASDYGLAHIATGEILRRAIAQGSELGQRVEPILAAGELVPDELTVALIRQRLAQEDAREGFILDGFPRTLVQARELDAMLNEIGRTLDAIFFFNVPDEVALERIESRAQAEGRSDDTREATARRLQIYHEQTEPVVEHYRATGKLVPLHAGRSVDEVFAEIADALEQVPA
jgi:adenylate kinase